MLSITLDPEIERRLSELARQAGKSEADYARELIEENIEDMEDIRMAEKRLANPGARLTSEQVRKELGLDD